MRYLLFLFCLLWSVAGQAQFRMVGNATWTVVDDSTFTGTVNFQADLTGKGYLPTQIADTFRLFTPTEQVYRVDSVLNTTFSSATLRLVEYGDTDGSPIGQVMVYNPDGRETVPQNPFGSTGATAQLQAAIDTYNARIGNEATTESSFRRIDVDTFTNGNLTAIVFYEGNSAAFSTSAAGEYTFTAGPDTYVRALSIQGDNTTLNASQEIVLTIDNTTNAFATRFVVQLYDANNDALVDQQVTGTVHTKAISGTTTVLTVPGLNGFGATGYVIELR